jgi:ADP-ribosyl-[dinitrogen reductase] hydrolase
MVPYEARCRRGFEHYTGCLLGGAVGDALGAPVEFLSLADIRRRFGPSGIRDYAPAYGRLGAITDDTQMSLFTAEGLILGLEAGCPDAELVAEVYRAYLRWLETQGYSPPYPSPRGGSGWLIELPQLHARRGPGHTCLSALASGRMGTMHQPLNDSKGCGGLMRVAPVGLICARDHFRLGCEIAAITHGHPSGYLAAGFQAELIHRIVQGEDLLEAITATTEVLTRYPGHEEVLASVNQVLQLAQEAPPRPETVEQMGRGWVAEEALGIALFCALTAPTFEEGVVLAVNHSGDSDSTGAIAGNILGALLGNGAIPERWLGPLELREEIENLAAELWRGASKVSAVQGARE